MLLAFTWCLHHAFLPVDSADFSIPYNYLQLAEPVGQQLPELLRYIGLRDFISDRSSVRQNAPPIMDGFLETCQDLRVIPICQFVGHRRPANFSPVSDACFSAAVSSWTCWGSSFFSPSARL